MIGRLRKRLTYGNVIATIALFIALGGTSYAATSVARNSVGAAQIRKAAVASSEVKNGSLSTRDFSRRTRRALRGPAGPSGPAGPAGGGGGGSGTAAGLVYKTAAGTAPAASGPVDEEVPGKASATASCDAGRRVTGGGVRVDSNEMYVIESYPAANGTSWTANIGNDDTAARGFTVTAICSP